MRNCDYLDGCPFFGDQLPDMPKTAELYKALYCYSDFKRCARLLVY